MVLRFSIAGILFKDEFCILLNNPNYDLFLGDRFFDKHKLIIDVHNKKLIHHGKDSTFCEIYFTEKDCKRVIHDIDCVLDKII